MDPTWRSPQPDQLLSLLSAILRVVSSTLDERAIGQAVVDEAVKLLHADRSAIYFFDDAYTTMLPFVAVDTRDPTTVERLFYPNPVPVAAQPLFEQLVASPAPAAVGDTYADLRTTRAFFELFDTRALLHVPLLARDQRLIGVLGFFWVGQARQFSSDDLALAEVLGRQAAIAFENARLYQLAQTQAQAAEREQQRQALLAEAGRLFSALREPHEILDQVARLVCESMGDSATITLIDPATQQARVAGSYQRDARYRQLRAEIMTRLPFENNPHLLNVLRDGQPILSNNPTTDIGTNPAWQIASFILVPLVSRGRTIGTLGVSSTLQHPRPYDADDLRMMLALADRAALALENARLLEESERLRYQAQEQAYELEAIFRNAPIGLALFDTTPEYRCVRHNATILELIAPQRQPNSSIAGIPLQALLGEQSFLAARQIFETVHASGEVFVIDEYAVPVPHSPHPRYYTWSLTPITRLAGQVVGLLLASTEITDQVRARQQVQELARLAERRASQLKTILESMADGVWVVDATGAIIDLNQRAIELLGLSQKREHLQSFPNYGELFEVRFPDGSLMPVEEYPLAYTLATGEPVVRDLVMHNLQTGRDAFLQVSAAPLRDERGQIIGAVGVGRDITERMQLMRQKNEFLSIVSHELKTPITAVKGFSQAMERRFKQKQERYEPNPLFSEGELVRWTEHLRTMVRQAVRLQRLVDDLLDLANLDEHPILMRRTRFNVTQLLAEVVEHFQITNHTHTIALAIETPEAWVDGDEARLEQVLTNILQNAIKYSPGAERIDVRLRREQHEVTIAVQDYGIGIPDEEQKHLFSRFFRGSNVSSEHYGGLGLGLYIARQLVERMGGTIQARSANGAGTTFTITLPAAEP